MVCSEIRGLVHIREGQALVYLERHVPHAEVPAPRLYVMCYEGKELLLIMQCVPGLAVIGTL